MADPIKITRNQLSEIIGADNNAVLNFEKIFRVVNEYVQTEVSSRLTDLEARVLVLETP